MTHMIDFDSYNTSETVSACLVVLDTRSGVIKMDYNVVRHLVQFVLHNVDNTNSRTYNMDDIWFITNKPYRLIKYTYSYWNGLVLYLKELY